MLPMAMHRKQEHPKRKQKSSATSRSGRLSLEHTILEEGLKPGPYSFSSSTISENVPDMESGGEVKKSSCAAIMISNSKTSRVGIPNRNLSVTVNNLPTNISQAKKSIDMRPLSVLPSTIKQKMENVLPSNFGRRKMFWDEVIS
ncbi:Elongation factor Ts [Dirofilaria immitis]